MATTETAPSPSYRAAVGERSFDFSWKDGQLYIDDAPVDYSFEPVGDGTYALIIDGRSIPVVIEPTAAGRLRVTLRGRTVDVTVKDEKALLLERFGLSEGAGAAQRELHAPMPGLVLKISVAPGDAVEPGDALLVLEAMKMENELRAEVACTVKALHVQPGDAVGKNDLLIEFEVE